MAQLNITFPDGVANRVLDAFAATFGYDPGLGVTKAQFAKQQVVEFIKETVKSHEANGAAEVARGLARQAVDSEVDVT